MLAIIPLRPEVPVVRELDDAKTLTERGDYFVQRGRDKEALRDYSRALALEPGCAGGMVWLRRGDILFRMREWMRAAQSYRNAIVRPVSGRGSRAWRSLAATLDKLGQQEEAIVVLDEYLVRSGEGARWSQGEVEVERARLLTRVGRLEEAAEAYERVADSDPTHAIEAGDHFLFERADAEAAWRLYDCHPAAECDVALITRRAVVAMLVGEESAARTLWADGLEQDPGIGEFARWWAMTRADILAAVCALAVDDFDYDDEPPTRRRSVAASAASPVSSER
jgi:tetratricopeptide (TPR) repeat protein